MYIADNTAVATDLVDLSMDFSPEEIPLIEAYDEESFVSTDGIYRIDDLQIEIFLLRDSRDQFKEMEHA